MKGGGAISFVPTSNQPGKAAGGEIKDDGTYELMTHKPGDGSMAGDFRVTITQVTVSPDLQVARAYYTTLGDERARRETARALGRATPFLRRQIGSRLRLKRVPLLEFFFDESIERGDRIERILNEISAERGADAAAEVPDESAESASPPRDDE